MITVRNICCAALLALPGFQPANAGNTGAPVSEAFSMEDINRRVDTMERLLQSQGLLDILQSVEQIQTELSKLRGEIEVQTHTLQQVQQKQRDLYRDLDNRLRRLEEKSAQTVVPPAPPPLPTVDAPEISAPVTEDIADTEPVINVETISNTIDPGQTVKEKQPVAAPAPAETGLSPVEIQARYQGAFKLLREARYTQAEKAFSEFLRDYPDSQYSDNAQFWLGETNFVMQQYQGALAAYEKLLQDYPDSKKVAQALLKIGYSHYELGDLAKARTYLKSVIEKYPGTTAGRFADDRLKEIDAAAQ